MLGADTQELVEELYPKGKKVLLMTKGGNSDGSLKTAARENLDAVLPGETMHNVGVTTGHILATVKDLRADFEGERVGIILAENGSYHRRAVRLASELREHGECGPAAKKVPFVLIRNSPSPRHQDVDYGDETHYKNGLFDAVIATPLDIEDVRIAMIESLLKVEGNFEALNLAAREKMLVQFEAMHQRLGVAYEALLEQFKGEPEVAGIQKGFAAIAMALPNMSSAEADMRMAALREVRLNTEIMLSRFSILRDRFKRGKVDTRSGAVGKAAIPLFAKLEKMIERLLSVGSKMRAADHGHSSFSWYKALKQFGEEKELTGHANSRHALRLLFEHCEILEGWAEQIEGFGIYSKEVAGDDHKGAGAKAFFQEFAEGLRSISDFAMMSKCNLLDMDGEKFSHEINNRLAPLTSSIGDYEDSRDTSYKEALNDDEKAAFERTLANVGIFSRTVQWAKDNLRKGSDWEGFLEQLQAMKTCYA